MNYELFNKIVIGIATIALSFTAIVYLVYFVGISTIWEVILDLGESSIVAMASVFAAFLSVLIAAIALWVSMRADKRNDKQARLSVRPVLASKEYSDIKGNIISTEFKLMNCGPGAAIIKNVVVRFEGEKIACNSHVKLFDFMVGNLNGCKNVKIGFIGGASIIKAGDEQNLWAFQHDATKRDTYFIDKVNVLIEYQSIYEDETFYFNTKEDKQLIGETPSLAQIMAQIHADCFTIPSPWDRQKFADLLPNPNIFYIKHEHGFAIGRRVDDPRTELITLAITPEHQNHGYGHALLKDFIDRARELGVQEIALVVAKNNIPALRIYKVAGFQMIRELSAYYKVSNETSIDAIAMRLDVKP